MKGARADSTRHNSPPEADFNPVARSYRWLEYLTFGPMLQQTRACFLPHLEDRRHALVFGDGDGRFLARLLAENPQLTADAVDTSSLMLQLLSRRIRASTELNLPGASRLRTHHQHALTYTPDQPPDLVATHFFLDCLSQPELDRFIHQLAPYLSTDAIWLISEFRIPPGALALPARWFVRALYLAFRLLTGLRVTHLPLYHSALSHAGFTRTAHRYRLFGLLVSERWQRHPSAILDTPEGTR